MGWMVVPYIKMGKYRKGIGLGDKSQKSSILKTFTCFTSGIKLVSFSCKYQTGLSKNRKSLTDSGRKYTLINS